jgi:hypothetical protein
MKHSKKDLKRLEKEKKMKYKEDNKDDPMLKRGRKKKKYADEVG